VIIGKTNEGCPGSLSVAILPVDRRGRSGCERAGLDLDWTEAPPKGVDAQEGEGEVRRPGSFEAGRLISAGPNGNCESKDGSSAQEEGLRSREAENLG